MTVPLGNVPDHKAPKQGRISPPHESWSGTISMWRDHIYITESRNSNCKFTSLFHVLSLFHERRRVLWYLAPPSSNVQACSPCSSHSSRLPPGFPHPRHPLRRHLHPGPALPLLPRVPLCAPTVVYQPTKHSPHRALVLEQIDRALLGQKVLRSRSARH